MTSVILRLSIDIGGGRQNSIAVRNGDDPLALSRRFCKDNSLPSSVEAVLCGKIKHELDKLERSDDDDKRDYYNKLQSMYKKPVVKKRLKQQSAPPRNSKDTFDRLYKLGNEKKERLMEAQERAHEERIAEELKQCTFQPEISSAAKEVSGGRMRGKGLSQEILRYQNTKIVRDKLNQTQKNLDLELNCSFKPTISSFTLGQRGDDIHTELFHEAESRKKMREEQMQTPRFPFHPEISKESKLLAETKVDLLNRLSSRPDNLEELQERFLNFDWKTGRKLYHPQVGRPPREEWARPPDLPVSDYLFYSRYQFQDIRNTLCEKEAELVKQKSRCKISEKSRQMAEEVKASKFSELWHTLITCDDDELKIRCLVEFLPEQVLRHIGPDVIISNSMQLNADGFVQFMKKNSPKIPFVADLRLSC